MNTNPLAVTVVAGNGFSTAVRQNRVGCFPSPGPAPPCQASFERAAVGPMTFLPPFAYQSSTSSAVEDFIRRRRAVLVAEHDVIHRRSIGRPIKRGVIDVKRFKFLIDGNPRSCLRKFQARLRIPFAIETNHAVNLERDVAEGLRADGDELPRGELFDLLEIRRRRLNMARHVERLGKVLGDEALASAAATRCGSRSQLKNNTPPTPTTSTSAADATAIMIFDDFMGLRR